jgi:hypothetical protein
MLRGLTFFSLPLLATFQFVVEAAEASQVPLKLSNSGLDLISTIFFENRSGDADKKCMPWSVPISHRCQYVKDHRALCGDNNGIVAYLQNHYCYFTRWCVDSSRTCLVDCCVCMKHTCAMSKVTHESGCSCSKQCEQ